MLTVRERAPLWQHVREEAGGNVVFHPSDGDRFALPIEDVIHACRSWEKAGEFSRQVSALLGNLAGWLTERGSEIESAYLSLEPDGVVFAVVRKTKAFDPAFQEALALLDLDVAQSGQFSLIKMRVIGLPCAQEESVASFLDLNRAFRYVGGHSTA